MKKVSEYLKMSEIVLPIEIGDELLGGRFKNKKIIVKKIDVDEKGQPTINDKEFLKYKMTKKMKTNNKNTQLIDLLERIK